MIWLVGGVTALWLLLMLFGVLSSCRAQAKSSSAAERSGEHETDSVDCWCEPRVEQPCPTCRASEGNIACRACGGEGWVEKWNDEDPCLVVHRTNRLKGA